MTDEQQPIQPENADDGSLTSDQMTNAEIQDIADAPPPADAYPEGQAEALEERIPEPERNAVEEAVIEAHRESEAMADSGAPKAFGDAVGAIEKAIETALPGAPEHVDQALMPAETHDTTVIFGRELPYPVYTVVFMALGILTVTEVTLSELLAEIETLKIIALLGIAFVKASLVALFYMHLKDDDRAFALAFGVPAAMVILSILFLLGVPTSY